MRTPGKPNLFVTVPFLTASQRGIIIILEKYCAHQLQCTTVPDTFQKNEVPQHVSTCTPNGHFSYFRQVPNTFGSQECCMHGLNENKLKTVILIISLKTQLFLCWQYDI